MPWLPEELKLRWKIKNKFSDSVTTPIARLTSSPHIPTTMAFAGRLAILPGGLGTRMDTSIPENNAN
jgi:hypothetical protein